MAARLVPRQKRLWVFGCGSGVGEGALALLQFARSENPSLRLVWLARNDRDLRDAAALGIRAVRKDSWRGFRLTLRAGVIVITHGFGDANRYATSNAVVVQLWHGVPFKRIHLDSPATLRLPLISRLTPARTLLRQAYVRSARGISLFATASALSATRIRSAFALPAERVIVTGDPRDDVLLQGDAGERRDSARRLVASILADPRASTARLLLYAPTWRDGEKDPAVPSVTDWRGIVDYLEASDSLLVIRSHPLGAGDYSAGLAQSSRIRLLTPDQAVDATPLLPAFDAVITDYSSIAFDYALVGGLLLYLAPDVAEYTSSHGLYERYRDFSGGFEVTSWPALIAQLEAADRDEALRAGLLAHSAWVAARAHAFKDGQNSARVFAAIARRVNGDDHSVAAPLARPNLNVNSVTFSTDGTSLLLSGIVGAHRPTALALDGARAQLVAKLTVDDAQWSATIPLVRSRWGGPTLPPPSGRYNARAEDSSGRRLDLDMTLTAEPATLYPGLFRAEMMLGPTGLDVQFSAPLTDEELGGSQQALLEKRVKNVIPGRTSVFFESYFGQNSSCNPRAIDRALAAARPGVERYWAVADASVEVPAGAIAVIEGTAAWWEARASARLIVLNDWLRKRYRRVAGRAVLQTWHGTPLKRIALDRDRVRPRTALATYREKSRWDIMLAQNEFSSRIFRSAYAMRKPIWLEGYPRDDVLLTGDASAVRERLGIDPDATVVLYAPTWRDDRPDKIDHLDVQAVSQKLGAGYVLLIRGHSRTMRPGADVLATGVIDVTGYPDISDLFLVADALVTDYSSVMFDYTVTGKPIYFFTPDLEHYRDELRGFYFDLLPVAPGPVLTDANELIERLRNPEVDSVEYAERYAAWRERFNPLDDGHAAERVVDRLIAEGYLD
jgi:CDP-glycerol glycerophosphotransferase (TagB/SpsB family)